MAAGLTMVLLAANGAAAEAASYEGQVKGDPKSQVDFTTKKQDGKRIITHISYLTADNCENGSSYGGSTFDTKVRIRHGKWDKTYPYAPPNSLRFAGSLVAGGEKAKGIINWQAEFEQPTGLCTSGELEWVAHKQ